MVNTIDRDYEEYSHYALKYSMVVSGVNEFTQKLNNASTQDEIRFCVALRNSAYDKFASLMTRARGMTDPQFDSSLEFFKRMVNNWENRPLGLSS